MNLDGKSIISVDGEGPALLDAHVRPSTQSPTRYRLVFTTPVPEEAVMLRKVVGEVLPIDHMRLEMN